jgi:hypothetical protein
MEKRISRLEKADVRFYFYQQLFAIKYTPFEVV